MREVTISESKSASSSIGNSMLLRGFYSIVFMINGHELSRVHNVGLEQPGLNSAWLYHKSKSWTKDWHILRILVVLAFDSFPLILPYNRPSVYTFIQCPKSLTRSSNTNTIMNSAMTRSMSNYTCFPDRYMSMIVALAACSVNGAFLNIRIWSKSQER